MWPLFELSSQSCFGTRFAPSRAVQDGGGGHERKVARIVRRSSVVPLLVGSIALLLGAGIMLALILLRKPPAEASIADREKPIRVDAVTVQPKQVPVTITGWGEVKSLNVVKIAPEVSGRVSEIHPNLLVGGIVPQGEPMFVVDPAPYIARADEGRARVAQLEGTLARQKTEWDNEKARMAALERARDLAKANFERLQALMSDDVGTQTNVDEAERLYVTAKDQTDQLAHELTLFPLRIRETKSMLEAAKAQLAVAELDLQKTRVLAPFNARVKQVALKKDQVVNAGNDVVTIADDSVLEISVPLDSRDARQWLQFSGNRPQGDTAWFSDLEKVECTIRWTEEPDGHCWVGTLDRVEQFDQTSRMMTVVVRIPGNQAVAGPDRLPLVEGMFCTVEIPGKTLENVYELPQYAVTFENTVYTAVDNRLKTVPVVIAKQEKQSVYVAEGLEPGQIVIVTRLVNPLENSLLDINLQAEGAAP